jgi:hypothetical protein
LIDDIAADGSGCAGNEDGHVVTPAVSNRQHQFRSPQTHW